MKMNTLPCPRGRNCRFIGIELLKIYLIDRNVYSILQVLYSTVPGHIVAHSTAVNYSIKLFSKLQNFVPTECNIFNPFAEMLEQRENVLECNDNFMQKVHCRQLGTFLNLFCKLFKRFNYFSSPAPQLSAPQLSAIIMFHQTCDNKVLEYNHSIQSVQVGLIQHFLQGVAFDHRFFDRINRFCIRKINSITVDLFQRSTRANRSCRSLKKIKDRRYCGDF